MIKANGIGMTRHIKPKELNNKTLANPETL